MKLDRAFTLAAFACLTFWTAQAPAAELVTLSPGNYAQYAPGGKEADAVIGDYVLRNDRIVAVVADPGLITGRSAQRWSIPSVAGCIIDLTLRDAPNDQLVAFYPTHLRFKPDAPQSQADFVDEALAHKQPGREPKQGKRVTLTLPAFQLSGGRSLDEIAARPPALRGPPAPSLEVRYTIEDGWDYVLVESIYRNPTDKPAPLNRVWTLRTDPKLQRGVTRGVLWVYDPARGQAWVVIPDGFELQQQSRGAVACREAAVIPARGELRVTMRLAVGRNVFDAMATADGLRGRESAVARIRVRTKWGPVEGASVQWRGPDGDVREGRTDPRGELAAPLPPGAHALGVASIAATSRIDVDTRAGKVHEIELDAGGMLDVKVTDGEGRAMPAKVAIHGTGDTADPVLGPESGTDRVGSVIHAPAGVARQELPPGDYRVVLSRGAEYEAVAVDLTVKRGELTRIARALHRTLDTTGWIAADLHNHSTFSGESQLFYMSSLPGYTRDASVDGGSFADPAGRVLSLACAGMEFGPAAEHNFTYTYEPLVEQLGLTKWLATCPGVGMTAGRRHAHYHINAFPVPYVRGAADGGTLQRAEHTLMQPWMHIKWPGGDKLMVICKPMQEKLTVKRGMDALDLYDLRPLSEGKAIGGTDNIALEWIDLLRKGYRLPGVVGSNAFDNSQPSGRQFVYVQSPTDDAARIEPMDVVHAVRAGRIVMTTGPFMAVQLATTFKGARMLAGPGAEALSADGRCSVQVSVQCPGWVDLEHVQVLVNGEHDPALRFAADSPAGARFERTVPLALAADAFVIVVATGASRADAASPSGGPRTHVAVANPIWVDVGGNGYAPHPPLDDAVSAHILWVRQPVARRNAEPGILRVRLRNHGDVTARDVVAPEFDPADRFEFVGPSRRAYELGPQAETDLEFRMCVSKEHLGRGLPADTISYVRPGPNVRVPRSATYPGRRATGARIVIHHSLTQYDAVRSVEDVAQVLAGEEPFRVERGPQLAQVRWGLIGPNVGIHAQVTDTNLHREKVIWKGSCVELFGANVFGDERKRIAQIYLLPPVGAAPAAAFREDAGNIVPAPRVQVAARPDDKGYDLRALVPVDLLPIDVTSGLVRLDVRVNATIGGGRMARATIFKSGAPHVDHLQYGRMHIRGKVQPVLELLRPVPGDPGGEPGRVRVTLTNTSDRAAADAAPLRIEPAGALQVLGEDRFEFDLAPGETASHVFDVALREGASAGLAEVWVATSPKRQVYPSIKLEIPVAARTMVRRPAVNTLAEAMGVLRDATPYELRGPKERLATLRLGVAGEMLAVEADIVDAHITRHAAPWRASCLEVFGAMPGTDKPEIGQVFLVPAVGGKPADLLVKRGRGYEPAPGAMVASEPTQAGYRLRALVPLKLIKMAPFAPVIGLEFQLTSVVAPAAKPKVRRGTLFGSKLAYMDASRYGHFRLTEAE